MTQLSMTWKTGTSEWDGCLKKRFCNCIIEIEYVINDDGVRTLTVWSDIRWPYMIYSCPPTSGMRARFRMETLARPPPCSGNQPSVLSSRVITCARTFTNESLIIVKKRKKRKRKREKKWINFKNRSVMMSDTTNVCDAALLCAVHNKRGVVWQKLG